MKKLFTMAITLIMSFSLIACGGSSSDESANEPVKEKTKEVITAKIYYYDWDKDEMLDEDVKVDKLDSGKVFSAFTKKVPLVKDGKINDFKVKKIDGVNTGIIDVSSDFELGDNPEQLYVVSCLAMTYLYNFDIDQISILVNGEAYSTDLLYIGTDDYIDVDTDIFDYVIEEEEEEEEPEEEYVDEGLEFDNSEDLDAYKEDFYDPGYDEYYDDEYYDDGYYDDEYYYDDYYYDEDYY